MESDFKQFLAEPLQLSDYLYVDRMPLLFQSAYRFQVLTIRTDLECLLVIPHAETSLAELRKHHQALEKMTGYHCVFYLETMTYYAKEKMIEDGIPFLWNGHQVHLPFLGISYGKDDDRKVAPCDQISFLTQKLLLTAIYEDWQDVSVTEASQRLGVSKMSITRCFDEMQALGIPVLELRNRARKLHLGKDKKMLWKRLCLYLRTPIVTEFWLEKNRPVPCKGGVSALAEYSLLEEDSFPIYAVPKSKIASLNLGKERRVPKGEEPGCLILEVGYEVPFGDGKAMDPLSLYLYFEKKNESDPRIRKALDEMLEEYVW